MNHFFIFNFVVILTYMYNIQKEIQLVAKEKRPLDNIATILIDPL